ncbi:MAG: AMP-binding protein [Prolixibacteraceae bacterium]|nr:AMP-binding protein [Prolixibacteraceae bacterium]
MTIFKNIILNGKEISSAELIHRSLEITNNPNTPEWEKELYLFLNEWFSDSDFVLAQTSGSTGEPKPIELPKSVMQKSAERTIEYFGLQKNNRLLLSLPCRYIAGKMMVVRAIVGQMNLITVDPATDFDFLEQEIFDFGAMVPNQVFKLLEQPSGIQKLQNIRNLLIGGSAISSALESQISQLSSRVVITYGMTETASHIAIRELSGNRRSDFYHCLPGIWVSLGETDCLQIHHPEFDEPIQTNDLAELQSDTSFRILGRADSVINSGGIKYSPESLEKKLEPIISRRFVISSAPDERLGEQLVLIIEGMSFDTYILKQKIALILTPYESPKSIRFIDRLPETNSGKIIRSDLKKMLRK